MAMPQVTLGFGGVLVGLGLGAYALGVATRRGEGGPSKTALIPAGYGAAFLGLGALARRKEARQPALGTAAALAGLGAAGLTAMVVSKLRKGTFNPRAMTVQATTAALSLGYAALGTGRLVQGRA
jgi:peptidoglycan/LPS O-acetylase OafA/YrhL